jgi:hypothetical protein
MQKKVQIVLSSWVVNFIFRNLNLSGLFTEEKSLWSCGGTKISSFYHPVRCQINISADKTRFFLRQHWKYVLIYRISRQICLHRNLFFCDIDVRTHLPWYLTVRYRICVVISTHVCKAINYFEDTLVLHNIKRRRNITLRPDQVQLI